uniref:G-protein coupled receptors family 1 profile domain-containing protein n=1 Tax=Neogobius melanostomus TaxID=47308 RepID=A0A8C6TGG0_9GOBI
MYLQYMLPFFRSPLCVKMNNSSASVTCAPTVQPLSIPVLMCLVCLVGFLMNVFSLWVFSCRLPSWSAGTVLQFNLALSDALVAPVTPLMAGYFAMGNDWHFESVACTLMIALLSSQFYGSTVFLTLISFHRYKAVVHCNKSSKMNNKSFIKKLCAAVWVFVISAFCYIRVTNALTRLNIITPKSLKVQLKSQRMIRLCLIIFSICFLPIHVIRTTAVMLMKFYPEQCQVHHTQTAYYSSWIVAGLNSCLDPMLYYFGSQNFREAFPSFKSAKKQIRNDTKQQARRFNQLCTLSSLFCSVQSALLSILSHNIVYIHNM